MGSLIAVTEASVVAVIVAAIPACIAAWASLRSRSESSKTRRENSEQHGESQQLLRDLAGEVRGHGSKLDDLKDDIGSLARRVDHAHDRIDRHIDDRIDDLNDRHGYGPGL